MGELRRAKTELLVPKNQRTDKDNWRIIQGIRNGQLASEQMDKERQKALKDLMTEKMSRIQLAEEQLQNECQQLSRSSPSKDQQLKDLVKSYQIKVYFIPISSSS